MILYLNAREPPKRKYLFNFSRWLVLIFFWYQQTNGIADDLYYSWILHFQGFSIAMETGGRYMPDFHLMETYRFYKGHFINKSTQ